MKLLILLVICIFTFGLQAQQLELTKKGGSYKISQNGEILKYQALKSVMESNSTALAILKKGKGSDAFAQTLAGIGGALIGFPLGQAIGGGDANWVLAGVGAGLVGISIPISSGANKKIKQAVELYNSGLKTTYNFDPQVKMSITGSGIGLVMQF